MTANRVKLLIAGVAVLFLVIVLAARLLDDGKKKELLAAPGFTLRFPHGTLLGETGPGTSILGAGTSVTCDYGTDASQDEIVSFFDAELGKLGYHPEPTGSAEYLVRQYRNGPFTFRLYLRPLPYRYGSRVIQSGYQHILITELSNRAS